MTEKTLHAQRISRETLPSPANLRQILEAEEQIAAMPDDDVVELQEQLGTTPSDPFPFLWLGLAALNRGQWQAAIDAFGHAIDRGRNHWSVALYIAQAAKSAGQIEVVDQACAAVLRANPEFWFARELPKHARGYYSQIGQDQVVEQFFAQIAPRNKVFVEVGAFDGVHYSNVRRLQEKYGWTGISFEPVTKNFRKLCAAYAGRPVQCVQSAVSTADREMEINVSTYPHLPDWGSDVATLGDADTARWEREFGATWTKEKVPVRRLTRLLDEAGIADFDFISIDTEGHDLEVLKSIDFTRYHPLLIIIEYGGNKPAIAAILEREGYGVLQDNGMDFIACPKALPRRSGASTAAPRTVGTKVEQVLEQFFAHQMPRTRTMAELTAGQCAHWQLARQAGWTCLDSTALASAQAIDLLTVSEARQSLNVLRTFDFGRTAPQVVAAAYGANRDAIVALLAEHHYSPLADEDGVIAAARFQHGISATTALPATKNFTGLTGKPAYNEIEEEFQRDLHGWLHRPIESVRRVVIVGGCFGLEVKVFLERYPHAEVHVFEPSQRHFPRLQTAYAHEPRVKCHCFAVSDRCGTAKFHEGSLQGTGSLLPVCSKHDPDAWVPFEAQEEFDVQLTTLDAYAPLHGLPIDLLWCDVQGAELQVLRGGRETLARCQAIFLEVANAKITYQGQCRFAELDRSARDAGFYLAGIGLCPSGNGTGNAAWLRVPAAAAPAPSVGLVPSALRPITGAELKAALTKLQPHLLEINYLPLDREVSIGVLDARELLTPARFDLPIKYLYAEHRALRVQSSWARDLYHAHIRAFSGGTCREGDGTKKCIDDYYRSFDTLLDEVQAHGFDPARTLVPIARGQVLIDGAHRVAACMLHRKPVAVLAFDRPDARFGFEYFQKQGLDEKSADAAALQYCRVRPDTFIVTVFPSAVGKEPEIRALFSQHGRLVYAKQVTLNPRGARNLICELYAGEPWLGDWRNNYAGANGKMEPCFRADGPVRVYVIEAGSLDHVRRLKGAIRDLFGIENHSVHINDTHAQTLQLAQLFFNANGIHFLNHAHLRYFERFARHLERYRQWLVASGHNPEHFCIDGSAVMAAYGIRDAQDLDVLHYGDADFSAVMPEVNSHNPDAHHHTTTRDDIIFNPENHFHAFGLKFASLAAIRRLKAKRNEGKDQRDVELIDRCCGGDSTPAAALLAVRPPKIIALIPARNEAVRLPLCLRALKPYVDAVVYLDDCSDDDSVATVESLAAECGVAHIIRKTQWHRDEPGDRNALLAAGRKLGGTHFVVLDADEAFTANCARDDYLRRLLLTLRIGESLALSWIQLWRSLRQYRFDASQWTYATKAFAFCDDGRATYQSGFIHTQRIPQGLTGRTVPVVNYVHGVLHFQFVNWPNLQIKQSWYRCMERIRQPQRTPAEINAQYAPSEDETGLGLRDAPACWFDGLDAPDIAAFELRDERRVREVLAWFRKHGVGYFSGLDIWRVDWASQADEVALAADIRAHAGNPAFVSKPISAAAHAHMETANGHLARGDIPACRAAVQRALAEAPDSPEILCSLGNLLFMTGKLPEARKHFEASLAVQPHQPRIWAQLAATHLRLKNLAGFTSALQRALEIDADCVDALRLMAEYHTDRGRHRDAALAYRKLAHLAPRDAGVRAQFAGALAASGEAEEARSVCEETLKTNPDHAATREVLARLTVKRRRAPAEFAVTRRN